MRRPEKYELTLPWAGWCSPVFEDAFRKLKRNLSAAGGFRELVAGEPIPIIAWRAEKPILLESVWTPRSKPRPVTSRESWRSIFEKPTVLVPASYFFVQGRGKKTFEPFVMRHPAENPMCLAGVANDLAISSVSIIGVGDNLQTGSFLPFVIPKFDHGRWLDGRDWPINILNRRAVNDQIQYEPALWMAHRGEDADSWERRGAFVARASNGSGWKTYFQEIRDQNAVAWQEAFVNSHVQYERLSDESSGRRILARVISALRQDRSVDGGDMRALCAALECILDGPGDLTARLNAFASRLKLRSRGGRKETLKEFTAQRDAMSIVMQTQLRHPLESRNQILVRVAKQLSSEYEYDATLRSLQRWHAKSRRDINRLNLCLV